ncbi:MAG: hypothetical protein G01um101430_573 [Parcubacteria group bacterium Gr01-1014_30]|nr:MAG: hypothetical protein G01um101430_573 [Parcubacteria group bacterium Gr01-1014_30]
MQILEKPIEKEELQQMAAKMFGNLVKAVVDVEREIVAIDGELHSDLAELLTEKGSAGKNLWGVNIYPDALDDWLEFDSVLNLKPHFGNRSRSVEDPMMREQITKILKKFISL